MSAELPDMSAWLQESALERRYVTVIAIGLLAMLALVATNQRSIFTPWDPGANPLLGPSAFFATPLRGPSAFFANTGRPFGGNGVPGLPDNPAATTPGGQPGGPPRFIDANLPDPPVAPVLNGDLPLGPGQLPFTGLPIGSGNNGGASPPLATLTPGGIPPVGAVPEPTTWVMLVLGFMMTGLALRHSRRTASAGRGAELSISSG